MSEQPQEISATQPAGTDENSERADAAPHEVTHLPTPHQMDRSADQELNTYRQGVSDLDPQTRAAVAAERSAASAERQEVPAWVQILLAFSGTFVAIIAPVHTTLSNRRSERIAKIQVRAYPSFSIGSFKVEKRENPDGSNVRVEIGGTIENFGQSPATRMSFQFTIFSTAAGAGLFLDPNDFHDAGASTNTVSAGGHVNQMAARTFCINWDRVTSGSDLIRFAYFIRYEDVFSEIIETRIVAGAIIERPVGSGDYIFVPDKEATKEPI
ncbi:hypothetical protein [Maricaulis sp.]|uniref:hypothetical protein n=1 Tax=Maricaulis sp. TaxID=1486257 RepID=UPI003A945843